ncbi:MAG: CHAT domain-containing tetratricopeptide repeat protein, partial [Blastocatellia bacterium]
MVRYYLTGILAGLIIVFSIGLQIRVVRAGSETFVSAENEQDALAPEPGKPVEREIAGGQSHNYQMTLTEGQFLSVAVEQRGIDVAVRLLGPDGKLIYEFDSEIGSRGQETVLLVAEVSGNYRLNVRATQNGAPAGRYEIRMAELRVATEKDRSLYDLRKMNQKVEDLFRAGKYDEAFPVAEKMQDIRLRIFGAGHPEAAQSLNDLAVLHKNTGDYAKAETFHLQALAIREKTLGPDHIQVGYSLNELGILYDFIGDYVKAEPSFQRALAIWEKNLGLEHNYVGAALNNLAHFYSNKKEDYPRAEELFQRALAIKEIQLGPEDPGVATTLYNLGLLYRNTGNYPKAEDVLQRALAIREKKLPPGHTGIAVVLQGIASVCYDKGDYAKAEELFQRALEINEKSLGENHVNVALSLKSLAAVYNKKGDASRAEPLYQRALAITEKALGKDHRYVASYLESFAFLSYNKGDYAKAEELYQRALTIREQTLGEEHPSVARTLINLSALHAARGNISQAITTQSRAIALGERNIARNLDTGSDQRKRAFLDSLLAQTNWSIALHVESAPSDPMARNLAATTILQRKGRVLDVMSDSLTALRRRLDAEDQKLLDRLKDATAQLTRLIFNRPEKMPSEQYQGLVKKLEEQTGRLQGEISRRSAEFRPRLQPITLEAVQAAIPADAALIEFAVYRPYVNKAYGKPRYVAYILRRQGEIQSRPLGEAGAIDEAIHKLRGALRDPRQKNVKELSRAVSEKVMQPVLPLLSGARQLLISPDGALNLIPFEALVDEQDQYLIGSYSFTYLTSGRDLLRLQVARASKSNPLVIAGPEYGEPPSREMTSEDTARLKQSERSKAGRRSVVTAKDLSDLVFKPLFGAEKEAEDLKKILPEATVLSKSQATKTALRQAVAPRILHVATHGFFLEDRPARDKDADGMGGDGDSGEAGANVKIENPLLRSGLALAGANLRKNDGDGILTALEVSGLNLWGTKLVALSACNTGVGVVKTGEGVYGLRRALVLAGSETQVSSLWRADDQVTRKLMKDFYGNLNAKMGRA